MLPLRSDEPTLVDAIDRGALVSQVGDLVATCNSPHVFGIHGDWGVGKTSFLHQVQLYLTGECPQQTDSDISRGRTILGNTVGKYKKTITVVWFEAWRYQNESVPVVALLQEIRSQLPWTARFRRRAAKLNEVAARSALLAMEDLTKKIFVQASKIQDTGEKWERENLAVALPSHVIRQHLQKEISTLLGGEGRLVVIVDDLDRCSADAAYALMEGIKIYLNLPSCVFILGMNQKIIEEAITAHMPKTEDDRYARTLKAREYLEKICQTVIHLPLVSDPERLLASFIEGIEGNHHITAVVKSSRALPANPRKIKAFANSVRRSGDKFAERLALKTEMEQVRTSELLVMIVCLYQFHPDLYRVLEAEPKFYEEIRRWANGNKSTVEILDNLRLPRPPIGKPSSTGEDPTLGDFFSDPGEPTVFRSQDLIQSLGPVTVSELREAIALL